MTTETMRAVVVPAPGHIEFADVPVPAYGEYEALVEILACSICSGTDMHIVDGAFPVRTYPAILGHESIGRVIALGDKVRNFKVGDLVLRPAAVRPGEQLASYASLFGGFAEYGIVADAAAILADTPNGQAPPLPRFAQAQQVVPPDFDPALSGSLITFKETLSFLYQLGVRSGSSVLILGSGTVALSFILGAKLLGAGPVVVTGRRAETLTRAREYGADAAVDTTAANWEETARAHLGGRGADYAVEAVGSWEVLQQGLRLLAEEGQIGVYGVAPDRKATLDWAGAPRTWSLRFIQPKEYEVHTQVVDQARLGLIQLDRLLSHSVPFAEIERGFALVREKKAIKVSVRIR